MKFRLLLPLLVTALYLGMLEVGLEIRSHRRGWDTLLFGAGRPPVSVGGDAAAVYGPDEEFPFRSRKVSREPRNGAVRVWVASSSVGEDTALDPAQLFANRLPDLCRTRGVTCEVLNASRAGFEIPDNTKQLAALAPEWRPQIALLYQLSNDLNTLTALIDTPAGDPDAARTGSAPESPRLIEGATRLLEHTTVYGLLRANVTSPLTRRKVLADTLGPAGRQRFADRLRGFIAVSREMGATPVLCTFATSNTNPDELSSLALRAMFRYQQNLSLTGYLATVQEFNAVVHEVAADEGVAIVDVAAVMTGRSHMFKDFVHFTPEGHAKVAEILAPAVTAMAEATPAAKGRA